MISSVFFTGADVRLIYLTTVTVNIVFVWLELLM